MPNPAPTAVRRPYLDAWPGFSTYDPMYAKSRPRHGYGDHVAPTWRMEVYRRAVADGWFLDIHTCRRADLARWRSDRAHRRRYDRGAMLHKIAARQRRRFAFHRGVLFAWPRRCAYCGARATHADHIVPRRAGGTHEYANLAPACPRCNLSKSGRTPDQWREYRESRGQCWPPAGAIHTREAVAA